jgi:FAS-associated factor 2
VLLLTRPLGVSKVLFRNTLTNQTFVTLLYTNDILVWGGDVRDSEAWSGNVLFPFMPLFSQIRTHVITASRKLQATTYPFVAFIALQPRRSLHTAPSHTDSITNANLTVLSRHAGPSIPASSAPTSASTLSSHLTAQVLPRVQPFLVRIKNAEREREKEKRLREEQDQAFRESAKRDRERIERVMRAEREAEAERRRWEAVLRGEAERRAAERATFVKRREERIEWSRWGKRVFVEPDPNSTGDGALRIAVTLPRTGRVIRRFGKDTTLTGLFMYVDSQIISAELREQQDSVEPPNGATGAAEAVLEAEIRKASAPESWWGFKLLLAYPRREIRWEAGRCLTDIEDLRGGGQIVVEMIGGGLLDEGNVESESESDEE